MNGRQSVTFTLKSSQFGLQPLFGAAARAARVVAPLETSVPSAPSALLRHLFWRHLDWRARINVLLKLGILPPAPEVPLPQHLEADAIARAEASNRLTDLWTFVMEHLPEDVRPTNPFTQGNL